MTHSPRSPALDGVRALAIGSVLAFHLVRHHHAQGGWLGVDVFFVLSGFLITRLLLAERERTGRIAVAAFYGRRVHRLYPALLLAVVLGAVVVRLGAARPRFYPGHVLYALTYLQDFATLRGWGHGLGLLSHTWSLAVEEHFYLVWPLVLVLVARRGRRAVAVVAALGALAGFVIMQIAYHPGHGLVLPQVYYRPDARSAALLVGCFAGALGPSRLASLAPQGPAGTSLGPSRLASLAPQGPEGASLAPQGPAGTSLGPSRLASLAPQGPGAVSLAPQGPGAASLAPQGPGAASLAPQGPGVGRLATPALLVLLVALAFSPEPHARVAFAVAMPLVWVATAVLLSALTSGGPSVAGAVLSCRPAVWFGSISYGVYLFHPLVGAVTTHERLPHLLAVLVTLGVATGLAQASYVLVERPILRLGSRRGRSPTCSTDERKIPAEAASRLSVKDAA